MRKSKKTQSSDQATPLEAPAQRQAESNFGPIVENLLNEIYIFSATDLKFVYVNQGARQNLGFSLDELLDLSPFDIKPQYNEHSFRLAIEPLVSGAQQKIEFDSVHQRKDGSTYMVEVHLQRMDFNEQQVFVAIILDITERVRASSDLSQARAFLESAPDAMVFVDKRGRIQVANRQMVTLLGYSQAELLEMNVDQLVPERLRNQHAGQRASYAQNPRVRGMGEGMNLSAITKDGQEIPIEVSLSPVNTRDGDLIAAAIRDISARRAVEYALREGEGKLREAKEVAESATASKTRFLAAASHDLRQPMQALRLYLSALTHNLQSAKAIQLSDKMNLSLDTMGELLDALLDISTLESGAVIADLRDVKLSDILDRVVAASKPQAVQKGLSLVSRVQNYVVHTDPALLERIVENFVSNAIRYTAKGEVSINTIVEESVLRISVSDTGVGIAQAELERIFDEYYQLDNSVRDKRKGLGLGLSIVKHIARILDHPVTASSVEGAGSNFSVVVPLGKVLEDSTINGQVQVGSASEQAQSQAVQVLIVDDDTSILDAMAELMLTVGKSVSKAENGEQAIALVKQGLCPDLLITDFRMPGMTGLQVIEEVRELCGNRVAAIIMTGDTVSHATLAEDLLNCSVLQKPINLDQLLAIVNSLN